MIIGRLLKKKIGVQGYNQPIKLTLVQITCESTKQGYTNRVYNVGWGYKTGIICATLFVLGH